jgi:hypothetical protein
MTALIISTSHVLPFSHLRIYLHLKPSSRPIFTNNGLLKTDDNGKKRGDRQLNWYNCRQVCVCVCVCVWTSMYVTTQPIYLQG